jgi:hypothetical protein
MMTKDLNYPKTQESRVYALMWINMVQQSLNEFNFMASEAGITG